MKDEERFKECLMEHNGVYVDFSRQRVTKRTLELLIELAERAGLEQKIQAMFSGQHINATEDRAVLHAALRVRSPTAVLSLPPRRVGGLARVEGNKDRVFPRARPEGTGIRGSHPRAGSVRDERKGSVLDEDRNN